MTELIRGIHTIRPQHRGCVLTIGNFDGVHLGHQAVLAQVLQQAQQRQVAATVMTFEPQPQELFQPQQAPARLTNWREKHIQLAAQGIERHLCVQFNCRFAALPATTFIEQVLVEKLGIEFLVVGDDFRFGRGREGDFKLLQQAGDEFNFQVVDTHSFRQQQRRVSSTAIRGELAAGDFGAAAAMLGRPYSCSGRVVHGQKRGRTIGFPTANVLLKRLKSPLQGVFAVNVTIENDLTRVFPAIANIGTRPTVNGEQAQLEVHLFDQTMDLYGKHLEVTPTAFIRPEQKFASLTELQHQIKRDVEVARGLATR
ncbi:MAG: bifunctional riboflavin kinase/FAD synthetase [Idiomarina sp.]